MRFLFLLLVENNTRRDRGIGDFEEQSKVYSVFFFLKKGCFGNCKRVVLWKMCRSQIAMEKEGELIF